MVAALQAWADAGLEDAAIDKTRLGVAVASGIGGVTTLLSNYDALKEKGPRRVSPLAVPLLMPNPPAANFCLPLGPPGPFNAGRKTVVWGNRASERFQLGGGLIYNKKNRNE